MLHARCKLHELKCYEFTKINISAINCELQM